MRDNKAPLVQFFPNGVYGHFGTWQEGGKCHSTEKSTKFYPKAHVCTKLHHSAIKAEKPNSQKILKTPKIKQTETKISKAKYHANQ